MPATNALKATLVKYRQRHPIIDLQYVGASPVCPLPSACRFDDAPVRLRRRPLACGQTGLGTRRYL